MSQEETLTDLGRAVAELEEDRVNQLVDQYIRQGKTPLNMVDELSAGMEAVGRRFKEGEYFLSELVFSAEIFSKAMSKVNPLIEVSGRREAAGKLIMGTVQGDIHDLGKNIVITMLKCAGFEVIDLGIDVPAAKFIEAVKTSRVTLVGLSALLTTAFDSMQQTITALAAAGLRDQVKIMIGGGPTSEEVRRYVGADFYGADAAAAVDIAKKVLLGAA